MNDRHPGDRALEAVQRRFPAAYKGPSDKTVKWLTAYLRPKLTALQPREGETKRAYRLRLMQAFSGVKWALVKRKIARAFTDANAEITDDINGFLEAAFVDGLNESAYMLALNGANMMPMTAGAAAMLIADGLVKLNRRKLKRSRDIAYNEERTQSAVHSAVFLGVTPEDLPEHVARTLTRARESDNLSYARVAIYGAADSGAYLAGQEAQEAGVEVEKTWLSIMDMNVRPSHKHLHGLTLPLDSLFPGYHGTLRYPHDPEAPPKETYRCRCRMAVHVAGKSPGEYSRRLLPTETAAYRRWRDAQIRACGSELELAKWHKRHMRG